MVSIPPIVDATFLTENPGTIIVDARWYLDGRNAREAYESGHIAGAIFVDMDTQLAAPSSPETGRHPLPNPEAFAQALSNLGIHPDSNVVVYDDCGGAVAGRFVWMLRAIGVNAALLNGSLKNWTAPLETGINSLPKSDFPVRPWPDTVIDIEDVAALVTATSGSGSPKTPQISEATPSTAETSHRTNVILIDARPAKRFRGEVEPVDPRPGHIPGAKSAPCSRNVNSDGFFKTPAELREYFNSLGINDDTTVVSYCGSGVTACNNLLALEYAGFTNTRIFPGSWSQWSADPNRPAEIG